MMLLVNALQPQPHFTSLFSAESTKVRRPRSTRHPTRTPHPTHTHTHPWHHTIPSGPTPHPSRPNGPSVCSGSGPRAASTRGHHHGTCLEVLVKESMDLLLVQLAIAVRVDAGKVQVARSSEGRGRSQEGKHEKEEKHGAEEENRFWKVGYDRRDRQGLAQGVGHRHDASRP